MIAIEPLGKLDAAIRVPGSKSYTQRAMVIASLAEGESILQDPLLSEDTELLAQALRHLGAGVRMEGGNMIIRGNGGTLACPPGEIRLGNNGTAIRLLAGVVSLGEGRFVLTGGPRLCERPMKPLLAALENLGIEAHSEGNLGYPPITIRGGGLRGGEVVFRDIESSQFVSALLIVAPFARADITIFLQGQVPSLPYVALTVETMEAFGAEVASDIARRYVVKSGKCYTGHEYRIEGDVSSASYFFLAAALLKGRMRVENINPRTAQGDIHFLALLERLGCRIDRRANHIEIEGGELPGGEMTFDLGAMPDMVPTLAILSAVRPGRTIIRNVAHLRVKESDRIAALVNELRKTGIVMEEFADGMAVNGGSLRGAVIETYNDHRIAMGFAVLGLAVPGIKIEGEACVGKSFPGFWTALKSLRGKAFPAAGEKIQERTVTP